MYKRYSSVVLVNSYPLFVHFFIKLLRCCLLVWINCQLWFKIISIKTKSKSKNLSWVSVWFEIYFLNMNIYIPRFSWNPFLPSNPERSFSPDPPVTSEGLGGEGGAPVLHSLSLCSFNPKLIGIPGCPSLTLLSPADPSFPF